MNLFEFISFAYQYLFFTQMSQFLALNRIGNPKKFKRVQF